LQAQIIGALNISLALTTCPKAVDLCLAYAKYRGYLKAQSEMYQMVAEGSWKLKSLTSDDLITVFISRSVWHASYSKLLSQVAFHPELLSWLENHVDVPPNVNVFSVEKQAYTFKDLKDYLERKRARVLREKGKRKMSVGVDQGGQSSQPKKGRWTAGGSKHS
jgi:hypothetical protein